LFGNMGGAKVPVAGSKPPKGKGGKGSKKKDPSPAPSAVPAQVAAPSPAAAVVSSGPQPAKATAPAASRPTAAPAKQPDLLDLLGFDAPMETKVSKPSAIKGVDLLDFIGGPAAESKVPASVSLASGHDLMSENIRKSLEGLERSSERDQELGSDQYIRVSSYKVSLVRFHLCWSIAFSCGLHTKQSSPYLWLI
jgi:hypothetical protein